VGAFSNAMAVGAVSYNVKDVQTNIEIDLADGNHDLEIDGSGNSVSVGNGNQNIKVVGSNTNVKTGDGNSKIVHYGSNSSISTGNGNQDITSIGDNKQITTGDGDDDVTFIGDNVTLDGGNGDNNVVFWGNNATITLGDGNDDVATFDQIYNQGGYDDLNAVFLSTLGTDIWEDWTRISRVQIDYIKQKSLMSKTQTWVYEDTYQVDTYFSRYVNGLKNVNIDLGGGSNTANLTIDKKTSSVIDNGKEVIGRNALGQLTSKSENVKLNKDYSYDTLLDSRKETRLDSHTKSNTRWGGVFVAAAAAVAAVVFTWGAALPYVIGAAGAAVTACDVGYKVGTGQTLHTGDWVNIGATALPFGASAVASACGAAASTVATVTQTASTIAGVGKGIYQASQGDYIGAAVSFGGAALSGVSAAGVGTAAGTNNLTGWGYAAHGLNFAANTANVIDKGIKIAEGDATWGDWLSLGLSGVSAYMSGSDLYSGTSEILKNNPVKEKPKEEAPAAQDKPAADGAKPDATKPAAGKTEPAKPAADTKPQGPATKPSAGAAVSDNNGGSTQPAPSNNTNPSTTDKIIDGIGDFVGAVVELPGRVIGGAASFVGEKIIGTDNIFGKGLDAIGDWVTKQSISVGNGVDYVVEGTGNFIVSPIDTIEGWFSDSKTDSTTATPDNEGATVGADSKTSPSASDNKAGANATADNKGATPDTGKTGDTTQSQESSVLEQVGEKIGKASKYVGGKIADGAVYAYDKTIDVAVGTYDAVSNGAYIYNQTILPTDAFNSLDFAVNKAMGKYDEDEEVEIYIN